MGIYDGGAGVFFDDFWNGFWIEAAILNGLGIFVKSNGAVGVVTEEVGFDKVIDNGFGVFGGTAGGFEETLLDDGDINMFKVLEELRRVEFSGCINPDHIPAVEGDGPGVHQGLSYSIGYLKALLAAQAAVGSQR